MSATISLLAGQLHLWRSSIIPSTGAANTQSAMLSLIATVKLNDINPQAWLADVLGRIADIPQSQLADLLLWNWRRAQVQRQAA